MLDRHGSIIAINKAWRDFAEANSDAPQLLVEGANYLEACDRAGLEGSDDGAAFAKGLRAVIADERDEFALEYPCHSPTERRWFVGRVTRFPAPALARAVVAHENITARKLAEERRKQSEEWLRAIFEASRDGILVEDGEHIVYVNRAYTLLLGYSAPEELTGMHVSAVVSPDDEARLYEFGRRRLRGESPPTVYEFKGRRRDGQLIDLEASVSTHTVADKTYITTAIRDIAERKQAGEALRHAHDELERRVAQRTAELARSNEALKAEIAERERAEAARKDLLRQLVTAQEEERRRIARELHDQTGQHLTAMILGLQSLRDSRTWDAATGQHLQQLQELTERLVHDVHALAWQLRPSALDDLGLHTALFHYVEQWAERSRIVVDFHSSGLESARLPPDCETALYRIVQEALTNVLKHSRADRVSLILERRAGQVCAIVEDNGGGFDTEAALGASAKERRLGLLGMRERVEQLGGTLNLESTKGTGTTVFVRIPLAEDGEGKLER